MELTTFYGWWIGSVSLFAFIALIGIWYHIGRKQGDTGQVYLAFSIFFWFLSGGVNVIYGEQLDDPSTKLLHDGLTSIFSLCNSLFILLALPWFKNIPQFLDPIIKSKYWMIIVGLPFLFSILPTFTKIFQLANYGFIGELDVYYSILTLLFLGIILWSSFAKRGLLFLAILSSLCILITLCAQLLKLSASQTSMLLLSAIFKSCLIMIFFALALSWIKELSERIVPDKDQMRLLLSQVKTQNGKFLNEIKVSGFGIQKEKAISLSHSSYNLLKLFSEKSKSDDPWLEIKPKSDARPGIKYEIKDHNEIKRLVHQILDGLYGKGVWSKDRHEMPLRAELFRMSDKRDRKVKINIPPQNIEIT